MNKILLYAGMALAAGLGAAMATPAAAVGGCERECRQNYSACWYSCTPGEIWCYALCADNYYACSAECG